MTRQTLLSSLLVAPFAALVGAKASGREIGDADTVILGPGRYTVAQGGGIRIAGASNVRIEGCTFESSKI